MRKIAVCVLIASLCGLAGPPASAVLPYGRPGVLTVPPPIVGNGYVGGCGLVAAEDPLTGPDFYSGVLFAAVVIPSAAEESVWCDLYVNGELEGFTAGFGTGVLRVLSVIAFQARPGDVVTLCTGVLPRARTCTDATFTPVVPDPLVDTLNPVLREVDPTLCAALLELAPVVNSLVEPEVIQDDGDVELVHDKYYDCPPYGT